MLQCRRLGVFTIFGTASFQNIWYWAFSVLAWTLATQRTLGVPYDMLLRARRDPEELPRVEWLAHHAAGRVTAVGARAGTAIAAAVGFALAGLFVFGFLSQYEIARASFVLAFPLAMIGYSTLRLALSVEKHDLRGAVLVRVLARRRFWHQVVAVLAILNALVTALALHPRLFQG
jgi:hypothetical protein